MSRWGVLLLAGGLLLAGLVAGLVYPRLAARLAGDWVAQTLLEGESGCNPVGRPCRAQGEGAQVTLALQADARPLTPFQVSVELAGEVEDARSVAVRFDMPDMDMGLNRFKLQRQGPGLWQGQVIIPICSTGRQDWQATVEVAGETDLAARFGVLLE